MSSENRADSSAPVSGARVAVVTGSARGIGRATAGLLARRGARVVVVDLVQQEVERAVEEIGGGALGFALDVSDPDAVRAFVADLLDRVGQIHVLVNNAGINRDAMLHKMTDEQWRQVLEVDLSGVFYACREIGSHMRSVRYGRIVNIASASWMGNVGQTNYAAAKGGVVSLTRSIAKELAFKDVTANAVCPGFIDTEMTRAMPSEAHAAMLERIPLRRIGTPRDVAGVVAFLASDEAAYVTGEVITVGGGFRL